MEDNEMLDNGTGIKKLAEAMRKWGTPIYATTYGPGDGVTRYRFFATDQDYFGPGNGIATVRGRKNAETWLRAYDAGYQAACGAHMALELSLKS